MVMNVALLGEEEASKTAVRLPLLPFSWFLSVSEKLREGEWRIEERACTFLSTCAHSECGYKISLIFVMLYCMLTWLETGLSKFDLSMHSISILQAMITSVKMSRLKCA